MRDIPDEHLLRALYSVTPSRSPDLVVERGDSDAPSQTLRDLAAAILREAGALSAVPASPAEPKPAPKDHVSMPQCWSVDVHVDGDTLVSIGHDWLSGSWPLEEPDERTILGAAQHLLSFIGYGLPPCTFDLPADETQPEPSPTQPAAPAVEAVEPLPKGWVPLRIEHEPGYPEDVAFGPQRMMDRLKKWLDRYFAMRLAASAAPAETALIQGGLTNDQLRAALRAKLPHGAYPEEQWLTPFALGVEVGAALSAPPASVPAGGEWRAPLLKLLDYADDSDGCQYGTLSTSLVRDLVNSALSALPPAPAGEGERS